MFQTDVPWRGREKSAGEVVQRGAGSISNDQAKTHDRGKILTGELKNGRVSVQIGEGVIEKRMGWEKSVNVEECIKTLGGGKKRRKGGRKGFVMRSKQDWKGEKVGGLGGGGGVRDGSCSSPKEEG